MRRGPADSRAFSFAARGSIFSGTISRLVVDHQSGMSHGALQRQLAEVRQFPQERPSCLADRTKDCLADLLQRRSLAVGGDHCSQIYVQDGITFKAAPLNAPFGALQRHQ